MILVTGATGYIGGRVVSRLLDAGRPVRVLARNRERALARPWGSRVDVVEGDLFKPETLAAALEGVTSAYYLVHSMYAGSDFKARDREAARNFVAAGRESGSLRQVIYLGGIVPGGQEEGFVDGAASDTVSDHLSSRAEVGEILRRGLPTTEFRAGPIIGSGSASFEMVRYLTERLPFMIAPKWILNEVQTIGIRDILAYLLAALDREDVEGVIDVGTDPVTFRDMMRIYADIRGLPRTIVPVPVLAPRLAALWVGFVTPITNDLAVPLVEGVVKPVVGDTRRARALFPDIEPAPYRDAVELALRRVEEGNVKTRWTVSGDWAPPAPDEGVKLEDREGIVREVRTHVVEAPAEDVFEAFASLGGDRGWRVWNWAWTFRGILDQLVGGPGLRRGRRHPTEVYLGEAIDFWRVEDVQRPHLLRLRAEMKVPGKAWLQFEAIPEGPHRTRLIQTAFFAPTGFFGWAYWYSIYPAHAFIFSDLVEAVGRDAVELSRVRNLQ